MPETAYDFVVFGSTPFAAILAGSLARPNNKRVLRIGSRAAPQRLPRRIDLALPLATRPQTWDLLIRGERQIRALLQAIGAPDSLVPINVRVETDSEAGAAFLSHLSHLAVASGLTVRRKAGVTTLQSVPFLRAERAEDKIAEWLAAAGVKSIDPHEVRMELRKSGAASLAGPDGGIDAGQIVLADDMALLELSAELRPQALRVDDLTSTLIGKIRPLAAPIALFPERGVSLLQRDDGSVLGLVSGSADIEARLASAFAGPFPIARLATGRSHQVASADAARIIGRLKRSSVYVAAGLGNAAVFFAPAFARYLSGAAADFEMDWFAAHDPANSRQWVSEAVN